jgi:hypothetical protein
LKMHGPRNKIEDRLFNTCTRMQFMSEKI